MLYQGDVPDIKRCKNNWELEHICEQLQNEIDEIKHENIELKKDIEDLKRKLSNQLIFY